MKQTLQWFKDHIGKDVYCECPAGRSGYTGTVLIDTEETAGILYNISQNHMGYKFSELQTETK